MNYPEIAPNFRPGKSCANCEHGHLAPMHTLGNIVCLCDKYGTVPPGGVCDDWEED